MVKVYSLKGHFQGQTIVLGGFQFVDGRLVASYATKEEHELLARHIAQWQATEEKDGERNIQAGAQGNTAKSLGNAGYNPTSDGQSDGQQSATDSAGIVGEGSVDAGGESSQSVLDASRGGPEASLDPAVVNLLRAIKALDPAVKEDWTSAGKPALAAIERCMGYGGVTRAQVEAVAPGYTRAVAEGAGGARP